MSRTQHARLGRVGRIALVVAGLAVVLLVGAFILFRVSLGAGPAPDDRRVTGSETLADRLGLASFESVAGVTQPRTLEPGAVLADALLAGASDPDRAAVGLAQSRADDSDFEGAGEAAGSISDTTLAAMARFEIAQKQLGAAEGMAKFGAARACKAAAESVLERDPQHFGAALFVIFTKHFTPKMMGGDKDGAMAMARAGLDRGDERYRAIIAALHMTEERMSEAADESLAALSGGVYSQRTLVAVAKWLIEQGRTPEALAPITAIARMDPDVPDVCDALALYFDAIGDAEKTQIARDAIVPDDSAANPAPVPAPDAG